MAAAGQGRLATADGNRDGWARQRWAGRRARKGIHVNLLGPEIDSDAFVD